MRLDMVYIGSPLAYTVTGALTAERLNYELLRAQCPPTFCVIQKLIIF